VCAWFLGGPLLLWSELSARGVDSVTWERDGGCGIVWGLTRRSRKWVVRVQPTRRGKINCK
jgi:hypothetical protein